MKVEIIGVGNVYRFVETTDEEVVVFRHCFGNGNVFADPKEDIVLMKVHGIEMEIV